VEEVFPTFLRHHLLSKTHLTLEKVAEEKKHLDRLPLKFWQRSNKATPLMGQVEAEQGHFQVDLQVKAVLATLYSHHKREVMEAPRP